MEKIDIGPILDKVKNNYLIVPGREVTIDLEPREGCFVYADRMLYDVFSNIVDNSIKHSKGSVDINISLNSVKIDDKKFYQVSIEDNGPGIKPDLKKRIFNRMYYEGGIMRGKGLGLYLVKTLVECFHGNVSVEDRIQGDRSKGSRFLVTLPAV
jgi:signal transduction histidine kinase